MHFAVCVWQLVLPAWFVVVPLIVFASAFVAQQRSGLRRVLCLCCRVLRVAFGGCSPCVLGCFCVGVRLFSGLFLMEVCFDAS